MDDLYAQAQAYEDAENFEAAENCYHRLLRQYTTQQRPTLIISLHLGIVAFKQQNMTLAEFRFNQVLSLAQMVNDTTVTQEVDFWLDQILLIDRQPARATIIWQNALEHPALLLH